jgi:predicted RNase H-like HicB family nuclease
MQYQVFVQSRTDGLFSATVVGVPDCVAEGTTQEEAVTKATATLRARLAKGQLFTVEVEEPSAKEAANPWLEMHGSLRNDPTFDDFMAEIAHFRQQREAEEPQP